MGNVVDFPTGRDSPDGSVRPVKPEHAARLAERAEVDEMRASLLAVRSRHQASDPRIRLLAERAATILDEMPIDEADRVSLLWHLSVIRELACDSRELACDSRELAGAREPVCALPVRRPPDDAV